MITLAALALETLILTDDSHDAYVATHSNRALPIYCKLAVLWGRQEGSLFFWCWLLSLYSGLVVLQNRRKNRQLMPYVISVVTGTGVFFASLTFFAANPFSELALVFSTHDFTQGAAIARRLVALEAGRVRYDGPLNHAPLEALRIAREAQKP